jgi:exopolysaccharide biosynthesis polyprenyl glycosylphosphotransferase
VKLDTGHITIGGEVVDYPQAVTLSLGTQRAMLRGWLLLTDALILMVAFRTAYWVRFDLGLTSAPDVVPDPALYPTIATVLLPLWLTVEWAFGLFNVHRRLSGIDESSRVFNTCSTAAMLVVVATFFWPPFVVSRLWLASAWAMSFVGVSLNRFIARRIAYALRRRGYLLSPAALVGTNQEAVALAGYLSDWRSSGIRLRGFVSSTSAAESDSVPTLPRLGSTHNIAEIIRSTGIQELIVAITAIGRDELLRLSELVDEHPSVSLRLSSGVYEMLTTRVTVRHFGPVPLLHVDKFRLSPAEVLIKSLVEYPLAAAALIVLSPLLLFIAALIKLDSPGPALHRRRVLGRNRQPFDAFKFRTMRVDGDAILARQPEAAGKLRTDHKVKDDPRITRVGRWLRTYSLDELPQLFNVIRGQMSVVGPRMISPAEAEKYGPHWRNLLAVRPGITGLWQVSGRSDLSYEDRVRLDMYYVRNYSVWLDLQILFVQTLPAVVKGRGAY